MESCPDAREGDGTADLEDAGTLPAMLAMGTRYDAIATRQVSSSDFRK